MPTDPKRTAALGALAAVLAACAAYLAYALAPALAPPTRVLFVGNSYTTRHDVDRMVAAIAASTGRRVQTARVAPGGWALARHARLLGDARYADWFDEEDVVADEIDPRVPHPTETAIRTGAWDFVVLQDQSILPAVAGYRQLFLGSISVLDGWIRESGAEPVLFMTWGRREKLDLNGIRFAGFDAMQAALADAYETAGRELDIRVAPVGLAWAEARSACPGVTLHAADGSHPTLEGAYLSALTLYAALFEADAATVTFAPEGVGDVEARCLRGAAAALR